MAEDDRRVAFAIPVTSSDPDKKDDQEKDEDGHGVDPDKKLKDLEQRGEDAIKAAKDQLQKDTQDDLSEEDSALKQELEMLVERLKELDTALYRPALESLRTLIRTSTSSMTSVPKPLKFLRPHYPELAELHASWPSTPPSTLSTVTSTLGLTTPVPSTSDKALFGEILSVLAMTYSDSGKRETLKYRLELGEGQGEDPGLWGHEYVRHLASEISSEYLHLTTLSQPTAPLLSLALLLLPFLLSHNAEPDAVDLLLELESIALLPPFLDQNTFPKVCLYMLSCVPLLPPPEDRQVLETVREIYGKWGGWTESIVVGLKMGSREAVEEDWNKCKNPNMRTQLAYILSRQQVLLPSPSTIEGISPEEEEKLQNILNNTALSENFKTFAKEVGVMEPKTLEEIYKSHLEDGGRNVTTANVDSARQNLAGTFVNAFVNAGFGNDPLMVNAEEGQSWVYKNKDSGMFSAAASLGVSLLWDTDVGLSQVDRYACADEDHLKAGAMLANGLIHSGIRTEMDVALALLSDHIESSNTQLRVAATIGLGIAYAGTQREDIRDLLLPAVGDTSLSLEISAMTALALGFIFVGSADGEVAETILTTIMERDEAVLKEKWGRFLALGLALVYLGRQGASDATIETLKAVEAPLGKMALVLVDVCSFSGTGNVLKIQEMLNYCHDHLDPEKEDDTFQAIAVLGIALVAMGEDVGAEMSIRQFNHLMHYGEPVIRRTVPLALGIISASNPVLTILDTLSRYSHDNDLQVALNAIFAMGLVGAGTNNARLAQMLRQLAGYYAKEPDCLFMVRIAQGLVHLGKGTIGINPFHTDRSLMSPVAVSGLLATVIAFTDAEGFILADSHWMLYFIVMAMYPRFLMTFDESGTLLPVTVRVGQAVDVVGQAGKPRTISGFQTHQTPVRLGQLERAELATEEYISYSHVLEGYVVLSKNEGFEKNDEKMDTKE